MKLVYLEPFAYICLLYFLSYNYMCIYIINIYSLLYSWVAVYICAFVFALTLAG